MKKLLFAVAVFGLGFSTQAQDKKFQIGLCFGPTINALKVQTTKIQKMGTGAGFSLGLGFNFLFSENVGIASGIQFDLEKFDVRYGDPLSADLGYVYYGYLDTEIRKFDEDDNTVDGVDLADTAFDAFQVSTTTFRAKYITIPFFLKFQTNKIGKMIYYGKFGLRSSFLASVRTDDVGYVANWNAVKGEFSTVATSESTLSNMKPNSVKKGLAAARTGVGIYGGTEWNFTGNTYLYGEVGFNYGITPGLYMKSSYLADRVEQSVPGTYINSQLDVKNNPQHIFEIKIGILF